MKANVEVIIPRPKVKEWEEPVAPQVNNVFSPKVTQGSVTKVPDVAATSLERVKERSLTEKLNAVLAKDEHLGAKSLSREDLEATFNNYSPVILNILKEEFKQEKSDSEDEKKVDEAEERDFLDQQRTSSLGSRAKSRSNKHTPESNKSKDTIDYNISSKCFSKLNFDKFEKVELEPQRISEEESVEETTYSQSYESMSSYRPINTQSPF